MHGSLFAQYITGEDVFILVELMRLDVDASDLNPLVARREHYFELSIAPLPFAGPFTGSCRVQLHSLAAIGPLFSLPEWMIATDMELGMLHALGASRYGTIGLILHLLAGRARLYALYEALIEREQGFYVLAALRDRGYTPVFDDYLHNCVCYSVGKELAS